MTLWDFENNSASTILNIIEVFGLQDKISEPSLFATQFRKYNDWAWEMYRAKRMSKKELRFERFRLLFNEIGIDDPKLIGVVQQYYIDTAPTQNRLMEGALEILDYLYPKYKMYIVSNGFIEIQKAKLVNSNIEGYFKQIFTSESIGYAKPDRRIFEYCIKSVNAKKIESLFIGDDPINDIEGPRNFGIDHVFYNPSGKKIQIVPSYEIKGLCELKNIL
jgi:putative hydrolase of the HAD superfamily